MHDHLGAQLRVGRVVGLIGAFGVDSAAQDQADIASFVLRDLLECGLEQTRLLLDHGEHRRGVFHGIEELEAADRQLDEVVDEVAAAGGELLLERLLAGIDRREPEDRVLLALEVVEERATGDPDLGAQLLDRETGEAPLRRQSPRGIGEGAGGVPLALLPQ